MRNSLKCIAVMALFAIIIPPVQAAGLDPYYDTLAEYNRIKPKQNPQWETANRTLKSKVHDNKNKVIGDLQDIVVSENGSIDSLNVDLNRLQLGEINLNYNELNVTASPRSYALGYDDDRIADIYPEILASIGTAAGEGAAGISIESLIRSDVKADDGRRIGKVEDVMFSANGDRVTALLVRVNYKTIRGESVAIPFSSVEYRPKGSRYEVLLADPQADTILEFADEM